VRPDLTGGGRFATGRDVAPPVHHLVQPDRSPGKEAMGMSGLMVGWAATALVGLALLLLLAIAAVLLPRAVRAVTTRTDCPLTGRMVEVRMLELDGRDPVCVVSCTGFAEPRAVTCGMPCIGGDHREDLAPGDRRVAASVAD